MRKFIFRFCDNPTRKAVETIIDWGEKGGGTVAEDICAEETKRLLIEALMSVEHAGVGADDIEEKALRKARIQTDIGRAGKT